MSSIHNLNICGPKIKELRLKHDPPLTQQQLAIELQILGWDIDRFGISKIERGRRQVTDMELVLLSRALKVSVEKLVEIAS